jgi:trans-2,3-dihydro-3-hydroxyanthranilate isomerase
LSKSISYFITDVFSLGKYSGNQLLTFLPGDIISDSEMQAIAREINFSETTFILSGIPDREGYPVRIFTPGEEIPFAGHPTLGTAYIIQQQIIKNTVSQVRLKLKVGSVPVLFPEGESGILWMEQAVPTFGKHIEREYIAPILGLQAQEVDADFPIEEVSTGLPFLVIPLKSLNALKKCVLNRESYFRFVNDAWAKNILVFCPQGYTNDQKLAVRVFPLYYGIEEDPATGSGNGCLAAYLVKNRYFKSDTIEIIVGQGYELRRPSQIYLKSGASEGKIKVQVGGKVIHIARGSWYL